MKDYTHNNATSAAPDVIGRTTQEIQLRIAFGGDTLHHDLASLVEDAIYQTNATTGTAAVRACLTIAERLGRPLAPTVFVDAMNRAGFPAWRAGEDTPAAFCTRRHSAIQWDIGGIAVFVAGLRPHEADAEYVQCWAAVIRERIAAELQKTEAEWPVEPSPSPQRQFERIDFLASQLRSRLMAAGITGVHDALREAWGEHPGGSGSERMRVYLEESATADVTAIMEESGYRIIGLATDPAFIADPHWRLTHTLLDDEDEA